MAGRAAVIFFFVLSGFVLALPFLKQKALLPYRPFLTKRICRIYPPYLTALIFAVGMNALCYRGTLPELSGWFAAFWQPQVDWQVAGQHLLLINSFDFDRFNPVIWSLVMEMRLSLLFPLIIFFALKFSWQTNLLGGILCSFIGWGFQFLRHQGIVHFENNYLDTFSYVLMFVVGVQLAKHRATLAEKFRALKTPFKYMALGLALLIYTNACWLEHCFTSPAMQKIFFSQITRDCLVTLAVAAFIIMSLASVRISRILHLKPLHYLGKISYSFYLYHAVCLITLLHLFYGMLAFPLIIAMVILTTLVLAAISYHWIEIPFIRLGKKLAESS